jgi:(p)ppGpp synthase/HD superfamily hydrolase
LLARNQLVPVAGEIATPAHAGQKYGIFDYIDHPVSVAKLARSYGYNEEVQAASLLHDTVEDTDVTLKLLEDAGFPAIVVEAVAAVTFVKDESVSKEIQDAAKIRQAKSHKIGHVVKFLDSSRNLSMTTWPEELMSPEERLTRTTRYVGYLTELRVGLPLPEEVEEFTTAYYDSLQGEAHSLTDAEQLETQHLLNLRAS